MSRSAVCFTPQAAPASFGSQVFPQLKIWATSGWRSAERRAKQAWKREASGIDLK